MTASQSKPKSKGAVAKNASAAPSPNRGAPQAAPYAAAFESGMPAVMGSGRETQRQSRPLSSAVRRTPDTVTSTASQIQMPVSVTTSAHQSYGYAESVTVSDETPGAFKSGGGTRASPVPAAVRSRAPSDVPRKTTTPVPSYPPSQASAGYDDDFEAYDEDFETFDEPHMHEYLPPPELDDIQRALAEENERAALGKPIQVETRSSFEPGRRLGPAINKAPATTEPVVSLGGMTGSSDGLSSSKSVTNLPQRQAVDLKAAHQRSQKEKEMSASMQKQTKRAKELAGLIDLDFAYYDIFDLAPLNEYELYIRNFGSSNTSQVGTQTGDDAIDRDAQTDDWYVEDKWTQAPSDQMIECASVLPVLPWLDHSRRGNASTQTDPLAEEIETRLAAAQHLRVSNSGRLIRFLRKSSQVMEILVEENAEEFADHLVYRDVAPFEFSKGFLELPVPDFVQGQKVVGMCFSPGDYRSVMVACNGITKPPHPSIRSSQGVIMIWRLNDPTTPYRTLVCEPRITCCCFAPTKPYLVFAATVDGSVQVWDLREPASDHINIWRVGQDALNDATNNSTDVSSSTKLQMTLRVPSYSTDGVHTIKRVHDYPIVAIEPLHKYEATPTTSGSDEPSNETSDPTQPKLTKQHTTQPTHTSLPDSGSDTFQLATVDASGAFQLWVLIELSETAANADADIGLRIGSCVKLMPSNHFRIRNPDRHAFTPEIEVFDFKFLRNDIDRFLVGTGLGFVVHESRFRDRCTPRLFQPHVVGPESTLSVRPDPVTAMDTCPHAPGVFLAGHASGALVMYAMTSRRPLLSWPGSNDAPSGGTPVMIRHAIRHIQWSPHRPAVFTVLDDQGNIYIWDLLQSEMNPRYVVAGSAAAASDRRPSHIVMSPTAVSATSRASLNNLMAAASRGATFVIGFDDGSVQVHGIDNELAEMAVDEDREFNHYLRGLVQ